MAASDYGDQWADLYDAVYADRFDTDGAVLKLSEMAAGGRLLDLGVGTGRLAIPLKTRGTDVHGIDASHAMLARLHRDPIGATIPTVIGDFAEVPVEGTFKVIVCAVSTLFMLPDRERQIRCLRRAREHVSENGVVVIEAFVPDPTRYDRGQRVEVRSIETDGVHLVLTHHDPVEQRYDVAHVLMNGSRIDVRPVRFRYAWPTELDLMARLVGLRLDQRHGGWRDDPFGPTSQQHVSVYRPE
jgi:SAM-dependent methyltransferase